MGLTFFATWRTYQKNRGRMIQAGKCRSTTRYHFRHYSRDIPPWHRGENLAQWKHKKRKAQARSSKCVPTDPEAIIRYVFPDSVEGQAIRVAKCESDHGVYLVPTAKNSSSTASGLFQEMSGWWDGSQNNYLGGHSFNPFDAMSNTRQALWLWQQSGGSFYVHWSASASCWS